MSLIASNNFLRELPYNFTITCPLFNNNDKKLYVIKDQIIPIIIVSIIRNQPSYTLLSDNQSSISKGRKIIIKLRLIGQSHNTEIINTLQGLTELQSSFNIDGVSFFTNLSINKVGNYRIVSYSDCAGVLNGSIDIVVLNNNFELSINKVFGSLKVIKSNQSLYLFDIVNKNNQHIENINSLPDLLVQTFFFKWGSNNGNYQVGPKTYLSSETNGIYNQILIPNDVGTYLIYLSAYNSSEIINDYFFYLYVLENNLAVEENNQVFDLELSYYLIESIYLKKKVAINNYFQTDLSNRKKFKYETGLTSSESLSNKIKKPQEIWSIPHRVDNSKGTVDPRFPWFNPRLLPPYQFGKRLNRTNKTTAQLILNNPKARGLNSSTLTNMIIEVTKSNGPNNFIISETLTNTDIILKNIHNIVRNQKTDPLKDNILRFKPITNKMDIIPILPQSTSNTGSSSSETYYQKYKSILQGCNC